MTPKTIGKLTLRRRLFSALLAFTMLGASQAFAASKTALAPEALSAKALLEDLLARRYTQGLATKVDKQSFSVSAELDLIEIRKADPKPVAAGSGEQEPISDLMLGMLDPEALMKNTNAPDDKAAVQKFLDNYKIKTVVVHIGLSEALDPAIKTEVEKWLTDRLTSEFGKVGKGLVDFIKLPTVKIPQIAPKTLWDWLSQFQSLAGQLALAAALILGVLLWQILTPRSSSEVNQNGDSKNLVEAPLGGAGAGGGATAAAAASAEKERVEREKVERDEATASDDIGRLTERLNELLPKVGKDIESIMRSWCQMGEPGWMKVATFAEAVGKGMGKLPIPIDALNDVSKVFARMTDVSVAEKRDVLQKSYWDLLTVLNLGPSALDQPFGYLGGFNIGMVSQVLLEQNPKMKTVVSLFMPPELRAKYMQGLSLEAKKELLESAAGMSEIASEELRTLDGNLMSMFKPSGKKDVVPLEMTLTKLVAALSPVEEILLLSGMAGKAVDEFKLSTPSLAFLSDWPDDKLSILLSQVSPDELSAYGRVRPDLKDRLLALAPTMTAEMVGEELARPDRSNIKDKGIWIESFAKRLKTMVLSKELNLDEIFSAQKGMAGGRDSSAADSTGEGTGDDSKRVA